jgi:uncharacterized membrane protein
MSWAARFRLRQYLTGSLWVLPLAGGVIGAVLGSLDELIDKAVTLPEIWTYSPSTASTLLATVVGATAALTGFVVTVTVVVVRSAGAGAVQAMDIAGLLEWARENEAVVAVRCTVGDFVPAGAILIEAYGGAAAYESAERTLRNMVALGVERTIEQDPAFAIRIMVDIADLALSPAVNDPTTAVQVLNHLGNVLRLIGSIDLSRSQWDGDRTANAGLVIPVRRWEDYLTLGTTEIREYGASSIQVMRRMRAMLDELHEEVLPRHREAVAAELARLDATVAGSFGDSVDFERAGTADPQGIGGRSPWSM